MYRESKLKRRQGGWTRDVTIVFYYPQEGVIKLFVRSAVGEAAFRYSVE